MTARLRMCCVVAPGSDADTQTLGTFQRRQKWPSMQTWTGGVQHGSGGAAGSTPDAMLSSAWSRMPGGALRFLHWLSRPCSGSSFGWPRKQVSPCCCRHMPQHLRWHSGEPAAARQTVLTIVSKTMTVYSLSHRCAAAGRDAAVRLSVRLQALLSASISAFAAAVAAAGLAGAAAAEGALLLASVAAALGSHTLSPQVCCFR